MLTLLSRIPPIEIESAERVLEGVLARTVTGNLVKIWPAMSRDREKPDRTRIVMVSHWYRPPTPEEQGEVFEWINERMRGAPEAYSEGDVDQTMDAASTFLGGGPQPPRRKGNA